MALRDFEDTVLPHLDAAFNYARWLTKNHAEAEDVVQDACVRAMRFFSSLRDDDARGWLFAIVRNTWYSRVSRRSNVKEATSRTTPSANSPITRSIPEERLVQQHTVALVRAALEQLPLDFREVIVLREIEGLSYKEIADVVHVPIGTVMSRLARARERLAAVLKLRAHGDSPMSCEHVERDLDAYLDRELDAQSAAAIRDHLSGCAACRRQVAEREALSRLVRAAPLLFGSGSPAGTSVGAVGAIQVHAPCPHVGGGSGAGRLGRRRRQPVAIGIDAQRCDRRMKWSTATCAR